MRWVVIPDRGSQIDFSTKWTDCVRERKKGNQGRRDNRKFLQLFGILSPCAKCQNGEALSLFVEKWGRGAISPERAMKANILRQELQGTHVQRGGQRAPRTLGAKTNR